MPQQQAPAQNSNIFWVQGESGAKAWPVNPGSNVALWDSEAQCIYIKMVDASGIPQPLRILDYTERAQTPEVSGGDYITADQLNSILDEKLNSFLDKINTKPAYHKKGGKQNGQPPVQ